MTSISGTSGSSASLTSYYAQLLAAKAAADDPTAIDGSDSETAAADAEIASLAAGAGSSASPDTGSLSTLLGSGSDGGSLASLLGSNFTDTNSLLAQIAALANGSATTDAGSTDGTTTGDTSNGTAADATSQQQKIASLLADMMQSEQRDFLSLLI